MVFERQSRNKIGQIIMEDMDQILQGLSEEALRSIKMLSECKDPAERKLHAETIQNLCESMGTFFDAVGMVAENSPDLMDDLFDDDDGDDFDD